MHKKAVKRSQKVSNLQSQLSQRDNSRILQTIKSEMNVRREKSKKRERILRQLVDDIGSMDE